MSFRAQPPANRVAGTQETDSTHGLFSAGYVFGEPIQPIENDPGDAAPTEAPKLAGADDTNWATQPANEEPSPIASTKQTGADSRWVFWAAGASSVAIALPDGDDIRSIWIPNIPVAISIALGYAGGSIMYQVNLTGGELVPIPKGTKQLTLYANGFKPDIWVYATRDVFTPTKSGITGSAVSAYTNPKVFPLRKALGANHSYALGDLTGTDLIGTLNGTFSAINVAQGSAIFPDQTNSVAFTGTGAQTDGKFYIPTFFAVNAGNDFSLECEIDPQNGFATGNLIMVGDPEQTGTTLCGWELTSSPTGVLGFRIAMSASEPSMSAPAGTLAANKKLHVVVAVSISTGAMALYVNGAQVATAALSGTYTPPPASDTHTPSLICLNGSSPGTFGPGGTGYNGSGNQNMQSFTTYPSALTAAQVLNLYNTVNATS